MILYLLKILIGLLVVYALSILQLITNLTHDNFIFLDVPARINLNLAYWDLIYFLWTNLLYIYMYFIPLLLYSFYLLFRQYYSTYYTLSICIFLIMCTYAVNLNPNLNYEVLTTFIFSKSNTLLSNNINKYHPLILHVCLNFLVIYYLKHLERMSITKYLFTPLTLFSTYSALFIICLLTMGLGSWWAYQEGSWGGWWAWDPSEVLGLVILFTLAGLFHFVFNTKKIVRTSRVIKLYCICLYLLYFSLQSNFSITSHNFGFQNESNFFLKIYYCIMIFICLAQFFIWLKNEFSTSIYQARKLSPPNFSISYHTVFLFILIIISFMPLMTDLLWKMLIVNFINFNTNYYILVNIFILLILLKFTANFKLVKIDLCLIFTWILFNLNLFYLVMATLIRFRISIFMSIHIILLAGIMYSLVSNIYYYTDWAYWPIEISEGCLSSIKSHVNSLSIYHPFLEEATLNFHNHSNLTLTSVNSVYEMPLFNLVLDNLKIKQEFLSDCGRLKFSGTVNDSFTTSISVIVIFFWLFAYIQATRYFIIRC